jgi:hypothetical protein
MNDYRIICDLKSNEVESAKLPLIIAFDGIVGESKSIRGLTSILIKEYADAEDEIDDWQLRVNFARTECMKAVLNGKDVVVYDRTKGIIKNNYAAAEGDSDYEYDDDFNEETVAKIYVDNERDFLLSLVKIGSIVILEREDSNQFKDDKEVTYCKDCIHNTNAICNVYKSKIEDLNNTCVSGTKSNVSEYQGGIYNNVIIDNNI